MALGLVGLVLTSTIPDKEGTNARVGSDNGGEAKCPKCGFLQETFSMSNTMFVYYPRGFKCRQCGGYFWSVMGEKGKEWLKVHGNSMSARTIRSRISK